MTPTSLGKRVLVAALAIAVLALLLGQLLGQPILLGYVETGSMEPTIGAGDGFVAVPSVLTSEVSEGDVVVYDATTLHDGGLTTHRVLEVTEDGYVTSGDANPFTDQDGGEPLVGDGQVVAKALQVNGHVVTIPHLGTVVMGVHRVIGTVYDAVAAPLGVTSEFDAESIGSLLVAAGVAMLGLAFLFEQTSVGRRTTGRSRNREDVIGFWFAVGLVLLVLVTLATAAMVIPSGTQEYGIVSTESPSDDPQVLAPGETTELTRAVDNAGYVPIVSIFDPAGGGVSAAPDRVVVGVRSAGETTISLTAPSTTGTYTRHVREYRYLTLLPPSVLAALHAIHPLVAIAAVNAVIVAVAVALIVVVFGADDIRLRRIGDHIPLQVRLQRRLRRWR